MNGKQFKKWFGDVAKSNGFEKSSGNWLQNVGELTKLVNLQKSNFANKEYVNFGFIINGVPSGQLLMHIGYRLSSPDSEERRKVEELLDLDSSIDDSARKSALAVRLSHDVFGQLQKTNTEADLLSVLKKQPHLNNVPLSVKKHLNLSD